MDAYLLKLTTWVVRSAVALYWNRADINSAEPFSLTEGLWAGFSLYWLISAFRHRAVKEKEPWFEQLRHLLPMLVGFAFVFTTDLHFGPLGRRFVSRSGVSDIVGLWLTGAGLAFAIWARWHLGENWSAVVSIRSEHELIGTGPYRYVRHPIYTGILVALIGTVLVLGEVRGLIGMMIVVVSSYQKARKEEKWLAREFGQKFDAHAKNTGMFLPRIVTR